MVASQERVRQLSAGSAEVDQLIEVLRKREAEGEGSRYDRLRAEREAGELRIDITSARVLVAAEGAQLAAFLPEGSRVPHVRGELAVPIETPALEALVRRAMELRADYRAEQ